MRFWLKDSERRPDPAPIRTDDRKAVLVGTAIWLVGLLVLLVFLGVLIDSGNLWWLVTCAIGIGLGLIGLVYTHVKRR